MVNWTAFNKTYCEKLAQNDHTLDAFFFLKKEQCILRLVKKFGRKREVAEVAWVAYLGSRSVQRGNLGFVGSVRLWLSKGEYSDKVHSKFI